MEALTAPEEGFEVAFAYTRGRRRSSPDCSSACSTRPEMTGGHLATCSPALARRSEASLPALPALWALQHAAFTLGGVSLTPGFLTVALREPEFENIEFQSSIPGMTKLVVAQKPPGGVSA